MIKITLFLQIIYIHESKIHSPIISHGKILQLIKLVFQISKYFMVRYFKVKLRYIKIPMNCDFKIFLIQLLMKPADDISPLKSEDDGRVLAMIFYHFY